MLLRTSMYRVLPTRLANFDMLVYGGSAPCRIFYECLSRLCREYHFHRTKRPLSVTSFCVLGNYLSGDIIVYALLFLYKIAGGEMTPYALASIVAWRRVGCTIDSTRIPQRTGR